jgi:dihydroorotase/N-acyl-D-amino-acid deacylase
MIALVAAAVFDLVLSNARVIDGTGAPWFRADVAVRGAKIAAIGDLAKARARRRIDLEGLALCPGFIDLLGQSEMEILVDPRAESKVRQGITTELTGEGVSPSPMTPGWIKENQDFLRKFKLKVDWKDLSGYFRRLRKARPAINLAILVGAAQVRGAVLGFDDVQPTPRQLEQMKKLVAQGMEQGAFGLSTGLIYQPGSFAKTDEIVALAQVASERGGIYATHLRSEGKRIFEALDEAFTIARVAHIPVEIWHLKAGGRSQWGMMKEIVARLVAARGQGIDVTADVYPYIASANRLSANLPDWVHEGGTDAMVARLRDPALRPRILKEMHEEGFAPDDILLLSAVTPEARRYTGKRLSQAAREMGKPSDEALLDLVEMDRGNVGVARFGMNEDDLQTALRAPFVAMDTDFAARGIDGPFANEGAHPRAFATTARILGRYARELKLFPVEEAVRRMTSLPARRIGLWDRGLLRPGLAADLVAFDPERVSDTATFEDPKRYPDGFQLVVVNGKVVLEGGKRTRERPGMPLLHRTRP